jgi:hypothetical protein
MGHQSMTDFRALCARMADELDHYRQLLMGDRRETHALAAEARAALAQPEPQEAMIPDQYKGYQVHVYRAGFHAGYTHGLTRPNAALAQPEPQGPQGPTIAEWELNYLEPSNWRQVPPLPEDLVSFEDHNPKHKLPLTVPRLNGIACPQCGEGLIDSDSQNVAIMTNPPQYRIHCPSCTFKGTRF